MPNVLLRLSASGPVMSSLRSAAGRAARSMLVVLVVAACDDDPAAPEGVVGSYSLRTANGRGVPTTLEIQDFTLEIRSGNVTLDPDGSCSRRIEVRFTQDGTTVSDNTTWACTYVVEGDTVHAVDDDDGFETVFAYSDNMLTLADDQLALVFRR